MRDLGETWERPELLWFSSSKLSLILRGCFTILEVVLAMCERVAPRLVQRVTWLETELVHVKVLGFQAQVYTIYASVYHNLAICHLRIMQSTRRKEWDSETRSMKFSPNLFVLCSWYHQTSDTQTVLWVAQHAGFIVHVCVCLYQYWM